ncbi:MAG: hypothetical protein PF637_10955 [Spirochaetes bacterium]|jgi:hypothetical protein|nr:hypothetical protein [Spirochaetota bacterium]
MTDSSFYIDESIIPWLTTSYTSDLAAKNITANLTYWSAANLVSTIGDIQKFMIYIMKETDDLINSVLD